MWLLLVPACLAIFTSSLTSASEPHYVITVPANLQQGTEEKACVTFLDLKGEVDLKIELKKDDQIHTITECKITTHDHSECYSFQVPLIKEDDSVWQLHVSAHGEHINVDESKKVVIVKKSDVCIVQTDKSTYKPGDIVKFRLMSVNHEFLPLNKKYPLVEIRDTNRNRIAQWLDVSTEQGFADFSFHLAHEPEFGEYKINIPNGCEKYFNVDKYVLRRWELKINAPSEVSLADKSVHLEVCGSYIYGKPVEGNIDLSVCLEHLPDFGYCKIEEEEKEEEKEDHHKCIIIKEETDSKGCVVRDIQLDTLKSSSSSIQYISYLDIDAELTEASTGHSEKLSLDIYLNSVHKMLKFLECEHVYHKEFPYHGKVQFIENKKPLANEAITISALKLEDGSEITSLHVVTDSNGIAQFSFNTSEWEHLALHAQLTSNVPVKDDDDAIYPYQHIPQDWLWLSAFYSKSDSMLSIQHHPEEISCHSEQSLTVNYEIHRKNLESNSDHLHFFEILLTKSGIFSYKEHKVDIKDQENINQHIHGSFPVKFHVDDDFFPTFNVFVFSILPNGETFADTTTFNVSPCPQSKVKLSFSEEQVRPGEHVNLEVTAVAGSLCSVRSVDKGYLLEKPHDDSSLVTEVTETLRNAIQYNQYAYLLRDPEVRQCPENTTMEEEYRIDVFSLFEKNHLKCFTNTQMKAPLKCLTRDFAQRSATLKKTEKKDNEKEIQRRFPRRYFPDTWLYELVPVGSDGHTVLNLTTPDSITKWVTDAVCFAKSGVASVKDVELTAFQTYFIDLIVPYYVIQGEKFTIQAVVYSYAKKCILIVTSLADSEDLITVKDKEQARCVCGGHSHSFTWDVSAKKPKTLKIQVDSGSLEVEGDCTQDALLIGKDHRKDSVEKTIVVKPKGYEEEIAQTFLILPSDKQEGIVINIDTPERLVPDSERAHLIIQGDIMANVVANLDDVIRMPEGCGEQNGAKMLRFAHTLDYLESIHELTPEQKAKSLESLVEGYQKQLTLRTENGSYAMFPGDHENIWLTAFVIKSLSAAQKYIYINENHIQQAVKWLHSKQLSDGCFRTDESYFNNYINEEGHIMFTTYVAIALLEHHVVYNGSIVEDALKCLKNSIANVTTEHNLAILAYLFTLSGDSELRDQMLKALHEKAAQEGTNKIGAHKEQCYTNTETASYVILALLSEKTVTIKTLEDCVDGIRCILKQQNPWGGFGSTQDTTIALQALAKYAKAINHKKGDATVTIHSESGFKKIVHIDKSNSLLVQTVDLPEIPGKYTVGVEGEGLAYVQSHVHYYALPEKKGKEPFSFNVSTEPSTCTHASQKRFDVHVDVSYSGHRENTNMVLIMLQHVSGYVPVKDSVKKLEKNALVERTEITNQNISIYLSKLTHEPVSLNFAMEQEVHVEHLQPSVAAILDYYDPDEHSVVEYTPPCVSAVAHCAVSPAERNDCGFPGVTKELCEQRGCCYDPSIPGTKWCFFQVFSKTEED
ncbi:alpha-2-macroglobulin-like [Bufo gargarizans]|uniref:alpha-2-macroglobulin-like n=1 Tax=Bufo gargarizans TaxID=30331 RepID=UPI001CF1B763|nr:alpha-2-macroglobulin-like [Bufo gargarizans]